MIICLYYPSIISTYIHDRLSQTRQVASPKSKKCRKAPCPSLLTKRYHAAGLNVHKPYRRFVFLFYRILRFYSKRKEMRQNKPQVQQIPRGFRSVT